MTTKDDDMPNPEIVGREGLGGSLQAVASQISAVEKQMVIALSALSAAMVEKDVAVRREILLHVERINEINATHWEAHERQHRQEQEAVRVALSSIDERLKSMNEFRGQITDIANSRAPMTTVTDLRANINERMDRDAIDTRRRFEALEATMRDRLDNTSALARAGSRVGEDLKTSQGAIVAAILFGIAILGIIIAIANFAK